MQTLADLQAFPSFNQCPDEHGVDLTYYNIINGSILQLSRHWCLLAEIVHVEVIIRLRLIVRDKSGHQLPVAFYPEENNTINVQEYKVGHTIAILYPHQHGFLDMTVGIRLEVMSAIQVIPLPLSTIFELTDDTTELSRSCQHCKKTNVMLRKCGRCNRRWYCGEDCQKIDWLQNGHKRSCKSLAMVKKLCDKNWSHFEGFYRFPL